MHVQRVAICVLCNWAAAESTTPAADPAKDAYHNLQGVGEIEGCCCDAYPHMTWCRDEAATGAAQASQHSGAMRAATASTAHLA